MVYDNRGNLDYYTVNPVIRIDFICSGCRSVRSIMVGAKDQKNGKG